MSEEPERPGTGPTAESKLERLKELSLKKTEAVITSMRPVPGGRPVPNRDPKDAFQFDLPRNMLLSDPK